MNGKVRIKVCGITRPEDALRAAEFGADALGLNFAPESPRCIDRRTAERILDVLPSSIEVVGVFVERSAEEMLATAFGLKRLASFQLHGPLIERTNPLGTRLVRAYQVRSPDSLRLLDDYLAKLDQLPGAVLLDGYAPGQHGGTGQTAPWELVASYRSRLPVILAGGLRPENVADAIRMVRPYAVDVASGVESAPGIKDTDKMRRFIAAVRSASLAVLAEANPR